MQTPVRMGSAPQPASTGSAQPGLQKGPDCPDQPTENSLWGGAAKLSYRSLVPEKLTVDHFNFKTKQMNS